MAIFHVATNTPPKSELIADWIHLQSWGPDAAGPVEMLGGFHLDDPDGEVGMQVFVVGAGDGWFQVPLTYRATPMPDGDAALIGEMEHSVLGPRFVYDGLADERFVTVLAGVAASGYGQALGFAEHDGRWYSVPDELIVRGHGSVPGRLAVDGFAPVDETPSQVPNTVGSGGVEVLVNDRIELTVYRQLVDGPAPEIGLTTTWKGQDAPTPLVAVRVLA